MIIPNPVKVSVVNQLIDEVTGTHYDDPVAMNIFTDAHLTGENTVVWGQGQRSVTLEDMKYDGDEVSGVYNDQFYRFRQVDTHDAAILAPGAGCPQPISVVRAHILGGGAVLAQQLDAAVAADNTVATLILETGLGTFVRFGGDWQELSSESGALDDLALVQVGSGAVTVYDGAEAARTTVSIFDLPVPSSNDAEIMIEPEETPPGVAPVASIPTIASAADLDMGVRYGETHPDARWYVMRRAHALNASAVIPAIWVRQATSTSVSGLTVDTPEGVVTLARSFSALCAAGNHPGLDTYYALIKAARSLGMLGDPDVELALSNQVPVAS
jgi:hypothetical protein